MMISVDQEFSVVDDETSFHPGAVQTAICDSRIHDSFVTKFWNLESWSQYLIRRTTYIMSVSMPNQPETGGTPQIYGNLVGHEGIMRVSRSQKHNAEQFCCFAPHPAAF